MAKVRGRFPAASGVATIAERPENSTLEIEIDANSIDTQDETRDAHMRSDDFFGVEEHPTISFRSTAVRPSEGENHWQVDGDLTIKGITRPITVDVEFLGAAIDPWGNKRIGFSGVVPEVNREDWGLTWNAPLETGGFLLSRTVRLEIEAELVKK
jgi:polyisoprenoid-binding protein YceI